MLPGEFFLAEIREVNISGIQAQGYQLNIGSRMHTLVPYFEAGSRNDGRYHTTWMRKSAAIN